MDHTTPDAPSFVLVSSATPDGTEVAPQQLVEGLGAENLSPDLRWTGAPQGTRSFAITCFDPDASTGSGFWHWVAWDIPAEVESLDVDPEGPHIGARFAIFSQQLASASLTARYQVTN